MRNTHQNNEKSPLFCHPAYVGMTITGIFFFLLSSLFIASKLQRRRIFSLARRLVRRSLDEVGLVTPERSKGRSVAKTILLSSLPLFSLFFVSLFSVPTASAVTGWTTDHNNCNSSYLSIDCPNGQKICAYNGKLSCGVPDTINALLPSSTGTADTNVYEGTGGYLMNCTNSAADCSSPWECKASSTCADKNLKTTCTASAHTSSCGTCLTGYLDCNGGGTGSDADGCEIHIGGICTSGSLTGTYESTCQGLLPPVCNTENVPFRTAEEATVSSSSPLLWGTQYGSGDLLNLSKNGGNSVVIDNDGNVGIGTTSPGAKLHVVGDMTIDGIVADTTFDGYRIQMNRAEANYIDASASGGYFIFTTNAGTNALRLFSNQNANFYGNVGIGTTTPANKLDIYEGNAYIENASSLGSELITNGVFDSDTGWAKGTGWSIGSGVATKAAGTASNLSQPATVASRKYRVVFTISGYSAGTIYAQLSGGGGGAGTVRSANGTYTEDIVAGTSAGGNFYLVADATFAGSIDNVSVKEIIGGNLTLRGQLLGGGTSGIKIDAVGNVGIGTTSPTKKLDVRGVGAEIGVLNDGTTDRGITLGGTDDVGFINTRTTGSATPMTFQINGDEKMRIDSAGNVGIGTTSPGFLLHLVAAAPVQKIASSTTSYAATKYEQTGGAMWVGMNNLAGTALTSSGGLPDAGVIVMDSADPLQFGTNGAINMTILNGGSVGIGTTSPGTQLEVEGTLPLITSDLITTTTNYAGFIAANDGSASLYLTTGGTAYAGTTFGLNNAGLARLHVNNAPLAIGTYDNYDLTLGTSNAAAVTVKATTGNVGIGTTSPTEKLDVVGNIASTGTICDGAGNCLDTLQDTGQWTASGSDVYYNTGNVGIGTTAPLQKLDIAGTTPYLRITGTQTFDTTGWIGQVLSGVQFYTTDPSAPAIAGSIEVIGGTASTGGALSGDLRFSTSANGAPANEKVRITGAGNVGIGTTSPGSKLEVKSSGTTSTTSGINITKSDGTSVLFARDDGRVGIGTTTPAGKLNVVGGDIIIDTGQYLQMGDTGNKIKNNIWTTNSSGGLTLEESGAYPIIFRTNNTEQVRIDSTGNVGIGTTAPGAKLEVAESGARIYLHNTAAGSDSTLTQTMNGLDMSSGLMSVTGGQIYTPAIKFMSTDTSLTTENPKLGALIVGRATENYLADTDGGMAIDFATAPNDPGLTSVPMVRMSIDNTGNVGIGTTNPSYKFQVRDTANPRIVSDYQGSVQTGIQSTSSVGQIGTLTAHPVSLVVGDSEKVRIDTTGNVGIGTTSPITKEHIYLGASGVASPDTAKGLTIESNIATGIQILTPSTQTSSLRFGDPDSATVGGVAYDHTTDILSLRAGGGDKLFVNSSGNVGIGTTSSSYKLDVNGSVNIQGANPLRLGGNQFVAYDSTTGGVSGKFNVGNSADIDVSFNAGGTSQMYIDATNGNVGIGTTSPVGKLHVVETGTSLPRGIIVDQYNNGTQSPVIMQRKARGTAESPSAALANDGLSLLTSYPYLTSGFATVGTGIVGIYASEDQTDSAEGSYIVFGTTDNGTTTRDERMRITHDGNVGIGTTSPATKLHLYQANSDVFQSFGISSVSYNAGLKFLASDESERFAIISNVDSTSNNDLLLFQEQGNNVLAIKGDGNVGIGTTAPETKLYVSGSQDTDNLRLYSPLSDAVGGSYAKYQGIDFALNAGATVGRAAIRHYGNGFSDSNSALAFWTQQQGGSFAERMRILGNGNVGIGTTSPTEKLDVSGNIAATGTICDGAGNCLDTLQDTGQWTASGSDVYYNTGNVGIGTTSPIYKLDVNGAIRIQDQLFVQNDIYSKKKGYINVGMSSAGKWYKLMTISSGTDSKYRTIGYNVRVKYINATISEMTGYTAEAMINLRLHDTQRFITWGWTARGNNASIKLQKYPDSNTYELYAYSPYNNGMFETSVEWSGEGASDTVITPILESSSVEITNSDQGTAATQTGNYVFPIAGNVGIGTTTPANKLEVVGSIAIGTSVLGGGLGYGNSGAAAYGTLQMYSTIDGSTSLRNTYNGAGDGGINFSTGGTTTKVRIDKLGNVGIGTTAPSSKLSIAGTGIANTPLTLTQIFNDIPYVAGNGMGAARIELGHGEMHGYIEAGATSETDSSKGYLAFGNLQPTNSVTEVMRINQNGNVGIGTNSPTYPLEVKSDATEGLRLTNSGFVSGSTGSALDFNFGNTANSSSSIQAKDTGGAASTLLSLQNLGGDLSVGSGKLFVQASTGNVGIGTTSPGAGAKLDVVGTIKVASSSNVNYFGFTDASTKYYANRLYSSEDYKIQGWNGSAVVDNVIFDSDTGNVGIGTTNPAAKLQVHSTTGNTYQYITTDAGSNSILWFATDFDGTPRTSFIGHDYTNNALNIGLGGTFTDPDLTIKAGNVGIGTTSPTKNLEVAGSGDATIRLNRTGIAGSAVDLYAGAGADGKEFLIRVNGGADEAFRIQADKDSIFSGNVGIGTTSPASLLDVAGTMRVQQVCDEAGANCKDVSANDWANNSGIFVGVSIASNGNAAHDTLAGYKAANDLCNDTVAGSHVCSADEMNRTIAMVSDLTTLSGWEASGITQVWINSGGAKYAPAPVPANDCIGWTDNSLTAFGSFWKLDATTGGRGGIGYCNTSKAFACCK